MSTPCYARQLLPRLPLDVPIYVLGTVPQQLSYDAAFLRSIEEMAEGYVETMRDVQPTGPYRVAGWSAGGIIAYEAARQLIGVDETIGYLGLIEPSSTLDTPGAQNEFTLPLRYIRWHQGPHDRKSFDAETANALVGALDALGHSRDWDAIRSACETADFFGYYFGHSDGANLRQFLSTAASIECAALDYRPQPLSCDFSIFTATDADRSDDLVAKWADAACSTPCITRLDAPHGFDTVPPATQELARSIGSSLDGDTTPPPKHPESSYRSPFTIQMGRPQERSLVVIPGAGASVAAFADLVQEIDPKFHVHGLQPRGLDSNLIPHSSVPAAAQRYLEDLLSVGHEGPYHLLGHSFGGWVAFDVARQALSAGRQVASLTIVDTDPPSPEFQIQHRYSHTEMLLEFVENIEMRVSSAKKTTQLSVHELARRDHDGRIDLVLERLIEARLFPTYIHRKTFERIVRVFECNINTRYVADYVYPGTLSVILPANASDKYHKSQGWRSYSQIVRCVDTPGNHMTMLDSPNVKSIADQVQSVLSNQ